MQVTERANGSGGLMPDNGVVRWKSRPGNVWHDAAMESFFSSLKAERTARKMPELTCSIY